jgi:predicted nucleic acid-binding protein
MQTETQAAVRNILADTSAWIASFYRKGHDEIKERLTEALERDLLAINGIILCELLQGAKNEIEYKNLRERLQALHYLSAPEVTWEKAARLSFRLRRRGIVVPTTDVVIAQTAIDNHCSLLHYDKHFDLIAQGSELLVERA